MNLQPLNVSRAQEFFEKHEVDVLVATSAENIFYATGYAPFQGVWNRFPKAAVIFLGTESTGLALPLNEVGFVADSLHYSSLDLVFFGRNNFAEHGALLDDDERWILDRAMDARPSAVEALAALIGRHSSPKCRIVVDQSAAPELMCALGSRLPDAVVTGGGEELWRLIRMVKTKPEIEQLRRAIEVNEAGIHAVHSRLGHASEAEIARVFRSAIGSAGGNVQHWIGGFGRRAGSYRLSVEDAVEQTGRFRFDCGVEYGGYCSDLGGTTQVGEMPTDAERSTYEALSAGVETAIETAMSGVQASKLYEKVLEAVRRAGLPNYHHSLVGHGIGIEPRDYPILGQPMKSVSPFLGESFDPLLEAGMVLNIECPLIQLSDGGFQHEITMVVEHDGARLLSKFREYRVL